MWFSDKSVLRGDGLRDDSPPPTPPPPSFFPVSSARDHSDEVALEHLARYDIKELQKLKLSDYSNADVDKDNARKSVLRERLALYFSTERGLDYDQKLREKVNPTLLFYTREDRYLELCELTIDPLILSRSSRENVDNMIKEVLVQVLASYQEAMKGHGNPLPEEGRKQLDCLADLMFYLTYKIEENELAKKLVNETSEQLDERLSKVFEERQCLREKFDRLQAIVANREADLVDAKKQISRHSAVKTHKNSKEIASVLVREPINMLSEENGMTLLDEAVELGDLTLIADMLAYADSVGNSLEAYLETQYIDPTRAMPFLPSPDRGSASKGCLTDEQFSEIAKQMLKRADDKKLVSYIKSAGNKEWPHNDAAQWTRIDAELKRRYVEKNEKMPHKVWQALKERQKKHRRFEKLAHFYEDAIIHVVDKYKKAPKYYADKAKSLLVQLSDAADRQNDLAQEAKIIANALTQSNNGLAQRSCSLFSFSKTQRLVKNARDKLEASSVVPQTLQSDVISATESNFTKTKINAMLVSLEGSDEKQKITRQRAVLARAAFKNTLQYLEKQCDKEKPDSTSVAKKEIMDGLIATYSSSKISYDEFIAKVQAQFARPSSDGETTLMSKRGCWPFWPKSAKLLYKDFNANKTILSDCPVQ